MIIDLTTTITTNEVLIIFCVGLIYGAIDGYSKKAGKILWIVSVILLLISLVISSYAGSSSNITWNFLDWIAFFFFGLAGIWIGNSAGKEMRTIQWKNKNKSVA